MLADSSDWQARANAGDQLAAFAGDPAVDELLGRLLLDPDNTAVTVATAEALLARRDLVGLRVFTLAYGRADDDNGNDLNDSMYSVRQSTEDQDGLIGRLRLVALDEDQDVRTGATAALTWLGRA